MTYRTDITVEKILELLEEHTQTEIAEMLNCSRALVSRTVAGQRSDEPYKKCSAACAPVVEKMKKL